MADIQPEAVTQPRAVTDRHPVGQPWVGLGARLANATMAHDLLAHCGEEMNHLSRFLPELFQEFKDVP